MAGFENLSEVAGADLPFDERVAIAAGVLNELSDQIVAGQRAAMPPDVYHGWARSMPTVTVELGLIQPAEETEGDVNVYMLRRPADDHIVPWRNKLHIPGKGLLFRDQRPDEDDFSGIVERVLGEAEGGLTLTDRPIQYRTVLRTGARGPEMTARLIARVAGAPKAGDFYSVGTMLTPPNSEQLLETHDVAIARVRTAAYQLG